MNEPQPALLPCPFCGSHALLDAHADDCYFTLHSRLKGSGGDASLVLEAHAAWNRRTPAPVGVEPVAWAFQHDDGTWHDPSLTEHSAGMKGLAPADQVIAMGRVPQVDAAAKALAECMDYPWEHMPEAGRQAMREHAQKVLSAAHGIKQGGQHGADTRSN